jgi:hypothetical protein
MKMLCARRVMLQEELLAFAFAEEIKGQTQNPPGESPRYGHCSVSCFQVHSSSGAAAAAAALL